MLIKIICFAVFVVVGAAFGCDGQRRLQYRGEDSDGNYGSYHQDDGEESNAVRFKRYEGKLTVKTLSPQEIEEVRGAIGQILSGYHQNPFTPLPPIQASNEKRSIPDIRAIPKQRSVKPSPEKYPMNTATKFNDYSIMLDHTKTEPPTYINEPLTSDEQGSKTSTHTTYDIYDTVVTTDLTGATINSLSSLPEIPGTDDIIIINVNNNTTDGIVAERDVTDKITGTNNYETETNVGITGATIHPYTIDNLARIGPTDTSVDIRSEIKNILRMTDDMNTSIWPEAEDKNNLVGATIHFTPTHSHTPGKLTNENTITPLQSDAEVEEGDSDEKPKDSKEDNVDNAESNIKDDMASFHPGHEPENVSEAASKAESEFEGVVNQEVPLTTNNNPANNKYSQLTLENPRQPVYKNMTYITKPTRSTRPTRTTRTTRTTTTTTTRTTTTKFQLDVPALLAIIANLTYDYEMNLTDNLNATLLKYSIPTCEPPTTTAKRGIFIDYEANATGTIVAKCFVCGLEVEQIPRQAHCADAFAGDFLPLVPVDMTARGKISKYRKYCRFADVPHYMTNETQPRSVFGRWTGGCSVRWIDLSGVYTQRSCRNRERATLGRHFASKRMAKLEMALSNVENGCIASPMATLVPLSRGISLYARFHACVCTGSWCNSADLRVPWPSLITGTLVQLLVVYISPHLLA